MLKDKHIVVDYIIVGAGSSGCVLSHRLSANPAITVALFEAGKKDRSWKIHMPAALTYNLETTKYNWFYHTAPEPYLNHRRLYWPRGKVLGGSSALNAMVYIRGNAKDFMRWEKEGAAGWGYADVLPYFKRSETYSKGANYYRGDSGPLKVTHRITENPLFDAFIQAGMQAGFPYTEDVNGAQQEGFGRFDMTIDRGRRCSAADAYLHPVIKHRKNLHCFTQTFVTKVLFQHNKAIGIEYIKSGKRRRCYAKREVILSGGAINSPHLLMLSGIGPAALLKRHHIKVLVDLPGVGKNLQDHLEYYMQYECSKPLTLSILNKPLKRMCVGAQWFLTHKGMAASSHLEAGAFIRSRPEVSYPDLQYHFLPGLVNNHKRDMTPRHAFQVHVSAMRPESRGSLELVSGDPWVPVKIQANYLQAANDLKDLVASIPITREIFNQPAFKPYIGREIQPGTAARTTQDLEAFIRAKSDSAYHPCGTCKMGPVGTDSVVNSEAKVYGVEGLRVIDASNMPSITTGNLNAVTIMIAEKVSDLIIAESCK